MVGISFALCYVPFNFGYIGGNSGNFGYFFRVYTIPLADPFQSGKFPLHLGNIFCHGLVFSWRASTRLRAAKECGHSRVRNDLRPTVIQSHYPFAAIFLPLVTTIYQTVATSELFSHSQEIPLFPRFFFFLVSKFTTVINKITLRDTMNARIFGT